MEFARPDVIPLLALVIPAAALLLYATARWQRAARARFGELAVPATVVSEQRWRRRIKTVLLLAALALLVLAAARPHLGWQEPVEARIGSDIVVALDVSLSMAANDVQPNRLERAKAELNVLLDRIEGDRVGLVVFAGAAAVRFPLTTDVEAARNLIASTEVDSAPKPGSSLAAAVKTASDMISIAASADDQPRGRALVLVSDGEDLAGELAEASALALHHQMPIYTIGVGTARGSTIPVRSKDGKTTEKTDRAGQIVRTHLDESTLRTLAQATGGRYYAATPGMSELDRLYAEIVRRSQSTQVVQSGITRPQEAFQLFGLLAFLALAIEWLVNESKAVRL